MDDVRRAVGHVLDQLGLGPIETPSRVAWSAPAMRLHAYQDPQANQPVLLMVPAPIKRGYLWDLSPRTSAVRQCLRGGIQVHRIDWNRPTNAQQNLALADHADQFIDASIAAIEKETGQKQVFLTGHSLGGTLAAIYTSLHPDRVRGLILIQSPVHFSKDTGALEWLVDLSPPAQCLTPLLGNAPGSFLSLAAYQASPATYEISRLLDWLFSLFDPQAMQTHLRVQRWTLDESPMAMRLFEQVVEWLYRENRFMRGMLNINGQTASPQAITSPILAITNRHCQVVPPESVLPFLQASSSRETQVLWYGGDTGVALQHVGALVGRSAHQTLWPQIVQWIRTH
ncbi:MAG: alpha/beta fold hydrolase [Bacillota bacterium]